MGRYDDIDPRDIDPETNRPYAGFSSPALDTSFHDGEMAVDEDDDLEDILADAINDALDAVGGSGGAKAVLRRALEAAGLEIVKKAAVPVEQDDDEGYPGPCTNPGGHEFPRDIEEHERCLCVHCGADGDA